MTEQDLLRIEACIRNMRKIAEPVGPMHSLWDWIAEMEEVRSGNQGMLADMTTGEKIAHCESLIG